MKWVAPAACAHSNNAAAAATLTRKTSDARLRKIGVVFALRKINDGIDLARQKAGEFGIAQIGLYELQVGFHSRPNTPETDRQSHTGQLPHDFPAEQARSAGDEDAPHEGVPPFPLTPSRNLIAQAWSTAQICR